MADGSRYADKLLPNQEFLKELYSGDRPYEEALHALFEAYTRPVVEEKLRLDLPDEVGFEAMSTPPYQLSLFAALIVWRGVRRILEIGTFVGHSTMRFSRMMGPEGRVTTIEVFAKFAALARANFERNGFADRIDLLEGPAQDVLRSLSGPFDLVFVDGAKQSYPELIELSIPLLAPKAMIVVDDVFFHGDALNETASTDKGAGCRRVLDRFSDDRRFEKLLLPIGNGLLVLYRDA
jgi:predicted O-methyltransferase YrrM